MTSPSATSLESILDDGKGHVNSQLAQAIFEWEKCHAQTQPSMKKQFSTRDGLRLVDESARDILSSIDAQSPSSSSTTTSKQTLSYNDLVQEGMVALLRSMSTYNNYLSHSKQQPNPQQTTFQQYAKQTIQSALLHHLARTSHPLSLPTALQTALRSADAAASRLRTAHGREPTLLQVANAVGIPPERLALYRKLHRTLAGRRETYVSVEDGREVYDPTLAGSMAAVQFTEEDDDNDGEEELEGGVAEDDWETRPPERIVAPLRDVISDTEELNNPALYTHHLRMIKELDEFLRETLTPEELEVIQLRFGLVESRVGGRGWSAGQIGERMGMEKEEVVRVASGALEKLRKAATGDDPFVEVSL
jgi:RNA polymerase sigma factor (sigma-70 family)